MFYVMMVIAQREELDILALDNHSSHRILSQTWPFSSTRVGTDESHYKNCILCFYSRLV